MFLYFIILTLVSIPFIIMGLLIWKKQKTNLIHEYHLKDIKDLPGYSASIGKAIFSLGILLLSSGIMSLFSFVPIGVSTGILTVGTIVIIIFMFRIQKKYSGNIT